MNPIYWIQNHLCYDRSSGPLYKKPVRLMQWQKDILNKLYYNGFYRDIMELLILSPKKIGKTSFISWVLLADALRSPYAPINTIITSRTEDQANISFKLLCSVIEASPKIQNYIDRISLDRGNITFTNGSSISRRGGGASSGVQGEIIHTLFCDELSFWKENQKKRYDLLVAGMASATQPLLISAMNQPETHAHWSNQKINWARKVKAGKEKDKNLLPVIYESDPSEDWKSPEVWKKVNPSLNKTVKIEWYNQMLHKVKMEPNFEPDFRRLYAGQNIGMSSLDIWLPPSKLKTKAHPLGDKAIWFLGLDLSQNLDLTSIALVSKHENKFYFDTYNFCPSTAFERHHLGRPKMYEQFLNAGNLKVFHGDSLDYTDIYNFILELKKTKKIKYVFYDPFRSVLLIEKLSKHFTCYKIEQTSRNFAPVLQQIESDYFKGNVYSVKDDPILIHCIGNARLGFNRSLVSKKHSEGNIDALMACLNAYGGLMYHPQHEGFSKLELIS